MITIVAPDDVWIPALERSVSKGDHVEVADEIGASFVAQGWKRVDTKKSKSEAAAADDKSETPKEV